MNHNNQLDFFRAILIVLVILIHIVNFGEHYPLLKNAILAFLMPSFLVVTGFLVNVDKPVKAYALYLSKIALAYIVMVSGYAALSLFLPVRDGLTQPTWQAFAHVLFIKSIGPYWFLHLMVVCGVLYYASFRVVPKISTAAKLSIFATFIILTAQFTPLLNIRFAAYYFVGVGIRHLVKDFSKVYTSSLWPIIPFLLLVGTPKFQDWATISILVSVFCFSVSQPNCTPIWVIKRKLWHITLAETPFQSTSSTPSLPCSPSSHFPFSPSNQLAYCMQLFRLQWA